MRTDHPIFRRTVVVACGLILSSAAALLYAQFTLFPPVRSLHDMVAAGDNLQVAAGIRMLDKGGNAVDAGLATILAAAVVEQSRFGLGGEVPIIIKLKGKPAVVVSGIGTAPALATRSFFEKRKPESWETDPDETDALAPIPAHGITSAPVPGMVDGVLLALKDFGTLRFADIIAPAIEYADGFPPGFEFVYMLRAEWRVMRNWPSSKAFFYPLGVPTGGGDLFRMPELAATLRAMAAVESSTKGSREEKIEAVRNYFYRGEIARKIDAFSEANGGLLRYQDMASFRAGLDTPRSFHYKGYEILKPGFWTQGPVMLETLAILENFDLRAMGHNSPEYIHTLTEAFKLAFADRDGFYGDPKFSKIPEEILLSASYGKKRAALINPAKASMDYRPGNPGKAALLPVSKGKSFDMDTTCVNVVDRWGNALSATPSGAWLPSVIVAGTGIPLSNRLQSFVMTPGHANEIAPGKRPRVTLSPTMVLKNGELVMVLSTPGGDNQDQSLLQVLLNVIEFGMDPQRAVEAPRFQSKHYYTSFAGNEFERGRLDVESRISGKAIARLREMGHVVQVHGPLSNGASPTLIQAKRGMLEGGADPRRSRFLFGR
ncbi:MAG: gamma-glutamyltransferase family protein [Bryobacterales bacterium]|nr:gamma-glutamyltransferase family protein [Bryobacterales bacterium]